MYKTTLFVLFHSWVILKSRSVLKMTKQDTQDEEEGKNERRRFTDFDRAPRGGKRTNFSFLSLDLDDATKKAKNCFWLSFHIRRSEDEEEEVKLELSG